MRRLVCILLIFVLIVSYLPASGFAETTGTSEPTSSSSETVFTTAEEYVPTKPAEPDPDRKYNDEIFYPINVIAKDADPKKAGGNALPEYGYKYMYASENLLDVLISFEGFSSHEYKDGSVRSIGYGVVIEYHLTDVIDQYKDPNSKYDELHAKYVKSGMTSEEAMWKLISEKVYQYKVTPANAREFTKKVLKKYGKTINNFCIRHNIQLNQHQFDAILDICYHKGASWISSSAISNEMEAWLVNPTTEQDFLNALGWKTWVRYNGGPNSGFAYRRMRDAIMFMYGEYYLLKNTTAGLEDTKLTVKGNSKIPYYNYLFYKNDEVKLDKSYYDEVHFFRKGEPYGALLDTDANGDKLSTYTDDDGVVYKFAGWEIKDTDDLLLPTNKVNGNKTVYIRWEEVKEEPPQTEPTDPSTEPTNPSTEATEPSTDATEPSTEATKPSAEPTEPSTEATKPSTEPTEPSTEATKPSTKPTEPSTETTKPSTEPTEPSTETTKPSTEPPTESTGFPFTDVGADNFFRDAVEYVYNNELMNGISDTTFDVYGTMTRAMVVTVLYRMENSPPVNVSTSFADVQPSAYYAKAVAWAQQNDIVNGVSETSFDPNDEITQEEFVTIL